MDDFKLSDRVMHCPLDGDWCWCSVPCPEMYADDQFEFDDE